MAGPAPTLSICIATFNRAKYIGQTLECLLAQLLPAVEIVILDSSTSDETERVVRVFGEGVSQLRYFRQAENHGIDHDFDRAVQLATGEFCWLMSDDDILRDGAVRRVLASLRPERTLIIVNAEVADHDLSRTLEPRRLQVQADRTYGTSDLDRLLRDTGQYITFIGCIIIRRSVWLVRDRRSYYGSLFIHVGVIFQSPLPGETLLLAEPLVRIRYGNATWRAREFEIWMFKWPGLIWSMSAISASAKAQVCPPEPWRELKKLLALRAKGAYSLREYRRWIEPRGASFEVRLRARAVALIPGPLANAIALLYYWTAGRRSRLSLYDARNSRYYFRNWLRAP